MLKNRIKEHGDSLKVFKSKDEDESIGNRMIKFPFQNIRYLLDDNAYDSDTYRVKTKENLFSVNTNNLLFLSTDLSIVKVNNYFGNFLTYFSVKTFIFQEKTQLYLFNNI